MLRKISLFVLSALIFSSCSSQLPPNSSVVTDVYKPVSEISTFKLGIQRTQEYLPLLQGKRVGVVTNQTGEINGKHLLDTLLGMKVNVVCVLAPEHGFRGNADAGAHINDSVDAKTGVKILSIYGKKKKPSKEIMGSLDVVLFDMQDVGARFYTYISTLHYVMQACAENGKTLIVLDRPNPNGHYVDGPMNDTTSFIGMHPIPVVHGMTIGEYAQMINGEGWLGNNLKCDLKVIAMEMYSHQMKYNLPVHPSPNLASMKAIYLYPSICFFEGTVMSVGRGTDFAFEVYGNPNYHDTTFSFTPKSIKGKSMEPPLKGEKCYGRDLRVLEEDSIRANGLDLSYLIDAYKNTKVKDFFSNKAHFDLCAGSSNLRKQIMAGMTEAQIKATWQPGLEKFKEMRKKYLLYP